MKDNMFKNIVMTTRTVCIAFVSVALSMTPTVSMAGKKNAAQSDASTKQPIEDRELLRKKEGLRDIKNEQQQIIERFLRCIDAAKSLQELNSCERAEKDEMGVLRRVSKGH